MLQCEIDANLRENFVIENAIENPINANLREYFSTEYATENPDFNHIFDYDKIYILRPSTSK